MRYYKIYGLTVMSELTIEEAIEIELNECTKVDVRVTLHYLDKCENEDKPSSCSLDHGAIIIYIADVGYYRIVRGELINLEIYKGTSDMRIKTFLLGSSFGYLLFQRNMIAVHGSCVSKDNKGIIVTGNSGAGKSTISTALHIKGYDFISDDVCALDFTSDEIKVNLAYPQLKLCRDAAINLGYDLNNLIYLGETKDKYAIRLKDPDRYKMNTVLKAIFVMKASDDYGELVISELEGHEKLLVFIKNIFRSEIMKDHGMNPEYMKLCLQVVSKVQMYEINRPLNVKTEERILEFIESKVN